VRGVECGGGLDVGGGGGVRLSAPLGVGCVRHLCRPPRSARPLVPWLAIPEFLEEVSWGLGAVSPGLVSGVLRYIAMFDGT
jgi:hypothetical protein